MTYEMTTLKALLEKSADSDLPRETIGFTAKRPMEAKAEGRTGGASGERSVERVDTKALGMSRTVQLTRNSSPVPAITAGASSPP